jgi:hypothetical protein
MMGYMHSDYAASLSEFGEPHELHRCGGWVLKRRIPQFELYDAMGCYPLFVCKNWSQLHLDLEEIGSDLVSLALVTDAFGECDEIYLRRCFRDIVNPFKEHFIVDLRYPMEAIVCAHHRYFAR